MLKPSVTVLLATYNRAEFISECLDSILSQSYPPEQIVVIDDGSTDNTKEVVASYGDKIEYFYKENGGKPTALNYAHKYCTGDYIWIADDDDIAMPGALEALVKEIEKDPSLDLVAGRSQSFVVVNGEKRFSPVPIRRREGEPNLKISFLESMVVGFFGMLVRKKLMDEVGPWADKYSHCEDVEYIRRLTRHSKSKAIENIICGYRIHEGERGPSYDKISRLERRKRWFESGVIFAQKVYQDYSLEEYSPTFALSLPEELKQRATFLQRGAFLLKNALFKEGLEDFNKVISLCPNIALSEEEIKVIQHTLPEYEAWLYFCQRVEVIKSMRKIYISGTNGQKLVETWCRAGLNKYIRITLVERDYKNTWKTIYALWQMLGVLGLWKRVLRSACEKMRKK